MIFKIVLTYLIFSFSYLGIVCAKSESDSLFVIVKSNATLRGKPSPISKNICVVPANTRVYLIEKTDNGYLKIKYTKFEGYINDMFLQKNVITKTSIMVGEKSSKTKHSTSKTKIKKYRQSKSTSVRCSGYTKKGRRCKRTTTNSNGRCWQH